MTIADSSRELLAWICDLEDVDPSPLADVSVLTNRAYQQQLASPPEAQQIAGHLADLLDRGMLTANDPLASIDQPVSPTVRATMITKLRSTVDGRCWARSDTNRPRSDSARRDRAPQVGESGSAQPSVDDARHDVFVSHASEDKTVARPLSQALVALGWSVWLDELELTIGDSLSGRIDSALAHSRFGVVVLSPAFFAKPWPQRELAGLAAREVNAGFKVILPVWHNVDQSYIAERSPTLADRLGAITSAGIGTVAHQVTVALERAGLQPGSAGAGSLIHSVPRDSPHIAETAQALYEAGRSDVALPLWHHVVEEREQTLGPDHVMTLSAVHSTIYALVALKRYHEALPLGERLVDARERTLGDTHESTRDAIAWLDHIGTQLHT